MQRQPDFIDNVLVLIFLTGIYLGVNFNLAPGMPIPAVPAGVAGGLMLLKQAGRIQERQLIALLAVILLYLLSILTVTDYQWLGERFKGFVQLTYSLIIGYGFFLTAVQYERDRLARLFLIFCLVVLVGCTLENYTGFRAVSDAVREKIYDWGVYRADLRDQLLYGRVRPKFFTSEPSAVTFSYSLYAFAFYVLSTWRIKLILFGAMLAAGFVMMRGPTLLLGLMLVVPYQLFLASRWVMNGRTHYSIPRLAGTLVLSGMLLMAFGAITTSLYAERLEQITSGHDPSFFYRVIGPALTALSIISSRPIAGAGITGEEGIQEQVVQVFVKSPQFSAEWEINSVQEVLTNYFWYHWIYLGAVWGVVMMAALTWWIKGLGAPSAIFSWLVWATYGQASGAYVSPKTWFVLLLATLVSILHQRQSTAHRLAPPRAPPQNLGRVREPRLRPVVNQP